MEYKITCVCGHPFIVSDETLRASSGGTITCPACHQRLSPAIEMPVPKPTDAEPAPSETAGGDLPASSPAPSPLEPTKRCPFCGEVILAIARKCKHCGEFLDRAAPAPHAPPGTPLAPNVPPAPGTGNDPVYSLSVSQWDNFWRYLILATAFAALTALLLYLSAHYPQTTTFAAMGIPAAFLLFGFVAFCYFLRAKRTHIIIRPLRIDIEKGLLTKHITSLELFRIQDISLQQGLINRILGFGTIKLTTTDADSPELLLYQIPRAREVRHYLQTQVPLAARQRGAVYMEK